MQFNIRIFSGEKGINPINDNVDVEVAFINGDRYVATFFTLSNIKSLIDNYKKTEECCCGLYFWASDMIIVELLNEDVIKCSVTDLIKSGEFYSSFNKVI
ncbi:hypothetical protein LW347_00340 [Pectobacterium polonicum]|uniref:Uncharacterized protein n=1 Tax=Pectobacterium polonicum TaxID=2485124 RepID=A0AAE9SXE1_9GAMM|nr:hypothetical protein [Pectobacterium polonicum]UVO08498.1 hypothetical protein LW347_00340 [Pectobacterium polonicum]